MFVLCAWIKYGSVSFSYLFYVIFVSPCTLMERYTWCVYKVRLFVTWNIVYETYFYFIPSLQFTMSIFMFLNPISYDSFNMIFLFLWVYRTWNVGWNYIVTVIESRLFVIYSFSATFVYNFFKFFSLVVFLNAFPQSVFILWFLSFIFWIPYFFSVIIFLCLLFSLCGFLPSWIDTLASVAEVIQEVTEDKEVHACLWIPRHQYYLNTKATRVIAVLCHKIRRKNLNCRIKSKEEK